MDCGILYAYGKITNNGAVSVARNAWVFVSVCGHREDHRSGMDIGRVSYGRANNDRVLSLARRIAIYAVR